MRRFRTIVESSCLLVVGFVVVIMSLSMGGYGNWTLSPGLFPFVMGCILILLSSILLYQEIQKLPPKNIKSATASAPSSEAHANGKTMIIVMVLLTVGYGVLMIFVGFIISTAVYVCAVMFLLNERRWWMLALVPVLTSLTIYVVFDIGLQVYLA